MPSEPDYQVYLRRAAEVEALADDVLHQSDKETALRIAGEWRMLAYIAARRVGVDLREA